MSAVHDLRVIARRSRLRHNPQTTRKKEVIIEG